MAMLVTQSDYSSPMCKSPLSRSALIEKLRRLAWLTPDREFSSLYSEAIDQLEQILRDEESWLDQYDPEQWHEHVEVHARILNAAHYVRARVMQGEIATGREAAQLLADWFSGYSAAMNHAMAIEQARRSAKAGMQRLHWMQ